MNNNLDKKTYYIILFEYYKELLTEKQINAFISYYNEDYSLSEIASEHQISRNAVWEMLKSVTNLLEHYEDKLHLYSNDLLRTEKLNKLKDHADATGLDIINDLLEME